MIEKLVCCFYLPFVETTNQLFMSNIKDILSKLTDNEVKTLKENLPNMYDALSNEIEKRQQPAFEFSEGECYICTGKYDGKFLVHIKEIYDIDVYYDKVRLSEKCNYVAYFDDAHQTKADFKAKYSDFVKITKEQFDEAKQFIDTLNDNIDNIMLGAFVQLNNTVKTWENGK